MTCPSRLDNHIELGFMQPKLLGRTSHAHLLGKAKSLTPELG